MPTKPKDKPSAWLWTKPDQPEFVTQVPPGNWDEMWESSGYVVTALDPKEYTPYRAILVDPAAKTIEVVELDFTNPVYKQLVTHVQPIYGVLDAITLDDENVMYLDDNGIAAGTPTFLCPPYPQWLHGRGVILGYDEEGDSSDATVDIDALRKRIKFR